MATTDKRQAAELVEQLMTGAFHAARDPRSPEYQAGARAALVFRATAASTRCPYLPGTAQADAFYAGIDEGHLIWRAHQGSASAPAKAGQ